VTIEEVARWQYIKSSDNIPSKSPYYHHNFRCRQMEVRGCNFW